MIGKGLTWFVDVYLSKWHHGFEVAGPSEISSNDVDILNDFFPKIMCLRRLICQHQRIHLMHSKEQEKKLSDDRKEAMQSNKTQILISVIDLRHNSAFLFEDNKHVILRFTV